MYQPSMPYHTKSGGWLSLIPTGIGILIFGINGFPMFFAVHKPITPDANTPYISTHRQSAGSERVIRTFRPRRCFGVRMPPDN